MCLTLKIEFELFKDIVPRTTENFRDLCINKTVYSYKDSIFHRVIPNFMINGGDYVKNNGTSGLSIYGPTFSDENFKLKHTGPGLLSMADIGRNTNNSQFFITLFARSHLDGYKFVFGKVTKGMDTVKKVASYRSASGQPTAKITIGDCGEL